MAANEDLIDFDIIETQKENIQSLPGGRSARELARIFSPRDTTDKLAAPSPNDTRTMNDAIRQDYEAELKTIGESDDPLDIYDRYVKWTLNAYPSAQATPESGLLLLLERAVKSFLSSNHYKNDPRYLRLWLHYIRLFSDSPRETFAFLARHHIGEGLALFYEEFAAWLEGAGRWTQADEVYRLGMDREARPVERLVRKYSEFQQRYELKSHDNGPSSPALPAVRPALAAKVDPFSSVTPASADSQVQRPSPGARGPAKMKSGKPKMAIFSDTDSSASPPAVAGPTKGWESIGSLHERRKENKVEAKPWAGETLKAGKKDGPAQKMTIFRDESNSSLQTKDAEQSKHVPEHRVREAINPRTGRRERVFVNLDAVYPDYTNPNKEVSFEELRAMSRGWMDMNWRSQKEPLKQISGNENIIDHRLNRDLPEEFNQKLIIKDPDTSAPHPVTDLDGTNEGKTGKARKWKFREVRGETQTVKMKFDSPTGNKIRRKSTSEPTMTMHTRAATDEIYSIFNQPLRAEAEAAESSDFEDDGYTSAGESTVTGRISIASSDFGDDETTTFHKSFDEDGFDDTQAESVVEGEWTEFSPRKGIPSLDHLDSENVLSADLTAECGIAEDEQDDGDISNEMRGKFVPQMPDDYNPPYGTYRDPAVMAQNRLPFMTPIVEQTEHSLASMTAARSQIYNAKTPSKPMHPETPHIDLLATPLATETPHHTISLGCLPEDMTLSPTAIKTQSGPKLTFPLRDNNEQSTIITDPQCNPTSKCIRDAILSRSLNPALASFAGYHRSTEIETHYASDIQKFMKTHVKRPRSGDGASFDVPILDLPGAERSYIIRRELGAGAYAPVYFAESIDNLSSDSENEHMDDDTQDSHSTNGSKLTKRNASRYGFEALKLEVGPPNPWEFYMIRSAHERVSQVPELSRAAESIIRVHELHVFKGESILVEDYRSQGTLLDLVNLVRNEPLTANATAESGLDEALAMFFTIELFRTVEALHACGILHGDIKADNCLVRLDEKSTTPASLIDLDNNEKYSDPREVHYSPRGFHGWRSKGLSLIDFGRAIDMRAFLPSVQFIADWETGKHECNEIREMRPWTHQIDLYGIAGTVHIMLFGKYLESTPIQTSEGPPSYPNGHSTTTTTRIYRIRETLKRYWEREIWNDVFDLLLNPFADRWVQMERDTPIDGIIADESTHHLPVPNSMRYVREKMEAWLLVNAEKKGLGLQIRKLEAIFSERKKRMEKC